MGAALFPVSGCAPLVFIKILQIITAAGMDETYGTYVDDECFDIHDYDDDSDKDTEEGTDDDIDDASNSDDNDSDTVKLN